LCAKGYHVAAGGRKCKECPKKKGQALGLSIFFGLLTLAAVLLMYYVILRADQHLTNYMRHRNVRPPRASKWRRGGGASNGNGNGKNDAAKAPTKAELAMKIVYKKELRSQPSITHKIKILVGFLQISTNLVLVSDVPVPSHYHAFIQAFKIVNLDFVPWVSLSCVATFDYFDRVTISSTTPLLVLLCIYIFYFLPSYYRERRDMSDSASFRRARKMSRHKAWKLVLFTVFLIYPAVSRMVLGIFMCKEVEGNSFVLNDFTLLCGSDEWLSFVPFAAAMTVVYPIGVPLLFFFVLRNHRNRFHEASVRLKLGFLYEAFNEDCWWFELVDMAVKLTLTSVLHFLPGNLRMPAGLVVLALFYILLLLRVPYIRSLDDRLHVFCIAQMFLLILCSYILERANVDQLDPTVDLMLSVVLIAITCGVILFFLYLVGRALVFKWDKRRRKKKMKGRGHVMLRRASLRSIVAPNIEVLVAATSTGLPKHILQPAGSVARDAVPLTSAQRRTIKKKRMTLMGSRLNSDLSNRSGEIEMHMLGLKTSALPEIDERAALDDDDNSSDGDDNGDNDDNGSVDARRANSPVYDDYDALTDGDDDDDDDDDSEDSNDEYEAFLDMGGANLRNLRASLSQTNSPERTSPEQQYAAMRARGDRDRDRHGHDGASLSIKASPPSQRRKLGRDAELQYRHAQNVFTKMGARLRKGIVQTVRAIDAVTSSGDAGVLSVDDEGADNERNRNGGKHNVRNNRKQREKSKFVVKVGKDNDDDVDDDDDDDDGDMTLNRASKMFGDLDDDSDDDDDDDVSDDEGNQLTMNRAAKMSLALLRSGVKCGGGGGKKRAVANSGRVAIATGRSGYVAKSIVAIGAAAPVLSVAPTLKRTPLPAAKAPSAPVSLPSCNVPLIVSHFREIEKRTAATESVESLLHPMQYKHNLTARARNKDTAAGSK
jgi:hypothetical protein